MLVQADNDDGIYVLLLLTGQVLLKVTKPTYDEDGNLIIPAGLTVEAHVEDGVEVVDVQLVAYPADDEDADAQDVLVDVEAD